MMNYKSDFLQILNERGYLNNCTDFNGLDEHIANNKKLKMYLGFDCTGRSLHVGHLVSMMILRAWQDCGHESIILLGGGTSKVGDPSGKNKTRQMLAEEDIEQNMQNIKKVIVNILGDDSRITFVNNDEWLGELKYINFLRDIGSLFSVNKLVKLDVVSSRLSNNQELSFIEFNYVLMQSYDFLILQRKYDCFLQIGGSDQWGNIINGVDLNRRVDGKKCYGLTTNLITNADGTKMGKTADGAVWLDGDMLDPYDYWQYFRNIKDEDVYRFLMLFTDIDIKQIKSWKEENYDINELKRILADAVTSICHGKDVTRTVSQKAKAIFLQKDDSRLPRIEIEFTNDINRISLKEVLQLTRCASSMGESKRLIRGDSVYIADKIIKDELFMISKENLPVKISVGKKKHFMLVCKGF